ncbi:unnamed protein product [Chondrus crispus]|uniref:Phosphoglycerate mutase n=1 Tax=Chondrus crispus TaxID=2769 RepID=R7QJL0_CHOCR|nr:unnamed protein product [Chondrus crispus]CDF37590.1 unnamed protein product [Chondrus crispus]|eukprot:XP_005717461.1 unnamed protein product [Chondrus crispus]
MTLASTVFVARHGERIDHVDRSWRDTAENPYDAFLTETGIRQARALGEKLAGTGLTHIFASPFYRTVQTANEVAKLTGLPIKVEAGICEFLNPEWFEAMPRLQPLGQLKKSFPLVDISYTSLVEPNYPETRDILIERAGRTARLLSEKFSGAILLVGHGISCEFTVRGITQAGPIPYISYCSLQTCKRKETETASYYIDGSCEPDISFMEGDIKPLIKRRSYK